MKLFTNSKVCFFGAVILGILVVFIANAPQEMSPHAAVGTVGGCCCKDAEKVDASKCTGWLCFKSCKRCNLNNSYTKKCKNGTKKCNSGSCSNECTPQTCDRMEVC